MRTIFILILGLACCTQPKQDPYLKEILINELNQNHHDQNWYVPLMVAIDGIDQEQANWSDAESESSIKALVSHIAFWNERVLFHFRGDSVSNAEVDNDLTFESYNSTNWEELVSKVETIKVDWEEEINNASEETLKAWATEIISMNSHNAYHTGQIIQIRKRNGWWKSKTGENQP